MKTWNTRGLTSLLTLVGFLLMAVTGLVLYVVPQGRIAYWVDWHIFGLSKQQWGDIHILSSLLFVVVGIIHVYLNWRPLWGYLKDKSRGGVRLKKELAISLIALVALTVSGIFRLPPLAYLLDLNDVIKAAWVTQKDYEPPFGHAELLSLGGFCQKTDIPLPAALAELRRRNLKKVDATISVKDIAQANHLSPLDLYRMIKHLERPSKPPQGLRLTPKSVEQHFAGKGIGNKTLATLAQRAGQSIAAIEARLAKQNIKSDRTTPLKTLAQDQKIPALELLKAALVEGYTPKR
ncbi:MAG: DUF4405 domain-containing protein [Deltaproteobacteria bacterium]|nr:DUF4405 domain-containing protein [Deltaproteobacteria bacterium]